MVANKNNLDLYMGYKKALDKVLGKFILANIAVILYILCGAVILINYNNIDWFSITYFITMSTFILPNIKKLYYVYLNIITLYSICKSIKLTSRQIIIKEDEINE